MTMTAKTAARPASGRVSLYEADVYSWAIEQAGLIRAGRLDGADLANIAEEIEALGNEQAAKLTLAYRLAAMHLPKLIHQPEKATESWRATIREQRRRIEDTIDDNPGLKPRRMALFAKSYARARREAEDETGLPIETFPVEPPFIREQVEDRAFWP